MDDEMRGSLAAMLAQERHYKCCTDYLHSPPLSSAESKPSTPRTATASAAVAVETMVESSASSSMDLTSSMRSVHSASATDLVSMVEEFALVVTDRSSMLNHQQRDEQELEVQKQQRQSSKGEGANDGGSSSAGEGSSSALGKSASEASFRDVREERDAKFAEHENAAYELQHHQHRARKCENYRFWRQQMFDWACMVVDSFGMDREIVNIAFNLLDRYVSKEEQEVWSASSSSSSGPTIVDEPAPEDITRDDYQLFAMTCLYLAVKIIQPYPRKIGIEALVDMSRGFYTQEDICVTERDILKSLNWRINPTTSVAYARLYWQIFPQVSSEALKEQMVVTSTTLTEIAVADSFFVTHKPSLIGLSAVVISARLHGLSDAKIQTFLKDITQVLPDLHSDVELATVYRQLELLYCQ